MTLLKEAKQEAKDVQRYLEEATALEEKGLHGEARQKRALAARAALRAGKTVDPLTGASALLLHCSALLEDEGWPDGPGIDEQLEEGLRLARSAKKRSRALEGQLLYAWSRAAFAKPGDKGPEVLDKAVDARFNAMKLFVDAAVEELPWQAESLRNASVAVTGRGKSADRPLDFEEMKASLYLELGSPHGCKAAEAEAALDTLFDAWVPPSGEIMPGGDFERRCPLSEFLDKLADAAERIAQENESAAAAAACRAPCEGGVPGLDAAGQALLQLVARDGAGAWEEKAAELNSTGALAGSTADSLAKLWLQIAPEVKRVTDADAEMSCGHSCSTCPTKDDCQVHTALKEVDDW